MDGAAGVAVPEPAGEQRGVDLGAHGRCVQVRHLVAVALVQTVLLREPSGRSRADGHRQLAAPVVVAGDAVRLDECDAPSGVRLLRLDRGPEPREAATDDQQIDVEIGVEPMIGHDSMPGERASGRAASRRGSAVAGARRKRSGRSEVVSSQASSGPAART